MLPKKKINEKLIKKRKQETYKVINDIFSSKLLPEDPNVDNKNKFDDSSQILNADLSESLITGHSDVVQNVTSSSMMVLDERTGLFVPVECIPIDIVENIDESGFIKMRLDETTGLFIEDSEKSVISQVA